MSNYERRESVEDVFYDMHGIKPKVEYMRISGNEYKIRLSYGGKSIVITERMERGRTKEVSLEYNNTVTGFPSVYAAECHATSILRG
jgi:hypothetical protein